jgi:hypothetical protein
VKKSFLMANTTSELPLEFEHRFELKSLD